MPDSSGSPCRNYSAAGAAVGFRRGADFQESEDESSDSVVVGSDDRPRWVTIYTFDSAQREDDSAVSEPDLEPDVDFDAALVGSAAGTVVAAPE